MSHSPSGENLPFAALSKLCIFISQCLGVIIVIPVLSIQFSAGRVPSLDRQMQCVSKVERVNKQSCSPGPCTISSLPFFPPSRCVPLHDDESRAV